MDIPESTLTGDDRSFGLADCGDRDSVEIGDIVEGECIGGEQAALGDRPW